MARPKTWTPNRLATLGFLAGMGVTQAVASMIAAASASALLLGTQNPDNRGTTGLVVLAAALVVFSLRVLQRRQGEQLALSYVASLRSALMSHVVRLLPGGKGTRPGLVMTRVVNDLTAIKNWIGAGVAGLVTSLAVSGGVLGYLYLQNPSLFYFLMPGFVIAACVVTVCTRPLAQHIKTSRRHRGEIAAKAGEVLAGRLSLLTFGRHGQIIRRFDRLSGRLNRALVSRATVSATMRSAGDLLFPIVALTGLATSVFLPGLAALTATELALVVFASGLLAAQLTTVAAAAEYWLAYKVAIARLDTVLALPAITYDPKEKATAVRPSPDSSLQITDDENGIDISAAPGEVVKLASLPTGVVQDLFAKVARLQPAGAVKVRYGGAVPEDIPTVLWWQLLSIVSQAVPLTHQSVKSNLTVGASLKDENAISELLETFGLDFESADAGPQDPKLGAALRAARVIYRKARIVLVDDPVLLADQQLLSAFLGKLKERGSIVLLANQA